MSAGGREKYKVQLDRVMRLLCENLGKFSSEVSSRKSGNVMLENEEIVKRNVQNLDYPTLHFTWSVTKIDGILNLVRLFQDYLLYF